MSCPPHILEIRSRILQAVRTFFLVQGYVEVETPVRIPAPALEEHIDAERSGDRFLRTSPELDMKCLVGQGLCRIFQIGPCFRMGERGKIHNPEFTMLEWYRAESGYREVLDETRSLLLSVCRNVLGRSWFERDGTRVEVDRPWELQTIEEVYTKHAGWNPLQDFDGDRFDLDMVGKIEPALSRNRPSVLIDYPVQAAALARCRADTPPVAERWEVYAGGVELANAFGELVDPVEQRHRFEACAVARRTAGKDVYPLDERFLGVLARGFPRCSGVALGIDRLVMLLTGSASIGEVRAFCP